MVDFTHSDQKKTMEKKSTAKIDDVIEINFKPEDAVLLSPSLGMPAIVKKEENGDAILELVLLSKSKKLQQGNVAFHLRLSDWERKDDPNDIVSNNKIFETFWHDKTSVNISEAVEAKVENFGNGKNSKDNNDSDFKLKLAHLNIFPWILENLSEFTYVYKVSVNLKNYSKGLYNIWWVNKKDHLELKNKPKWWQITLHFKALVSKKFIKELKEYGNGVKGKENIEASIYHPVYITDKKELTIGHITDVHLDSRMDIYGQSVASVIEVKENCQGGVTFKNGERVVANKEFYNPIKNIIANFNKIFVHLSNKLLNKSDVLVITGDLVDYNRGIHTTQTFRTEPEKPSKTWESLDKSFKDHEVDRNWFHFYKLLLQLYNKNKKPIFTMLGNHDYVNYAMAPWPAFGMMWNGVYDQNLTRYECALCFGPGFNNTKEFFGDMIERTNYVKWYTFFINPFADFVVEYGNQSMFMVDWGCNSNVIRHGLKTKIGGITPGYDGAGSLHHAEHLFREETDYSSAGKSLWPYRVQNYAIYKSWLDSKPKIKMLFMHATAICPRDDVSTGEIAFDLQWTDNKLKYGSFDNRREEIIKDVEKEKLHIVITGHSHRNIVFEVKNEYKEYALPLASGKHINTEFMEPKNLVVVSSSGGPLPKYLPGGPLICRCNSDKNKYETGFFYEGLPLFKLLYLYGDDFMGPAYVHEKTRTRKNHIKQFLDDDKCPHCEMKAGDMIKKPAKRHRPGGNILLFENNKVKIKSVFADHNPLDPYNLSTEPRKAVMCEENDVFTQPMKLPDVNNEAEFNDWDEIQPINIISRKPFIYFGHMDFPIRVDYITFNMGKLNGNSTVKIISSNNKYKKIVAQKIVKDSFEEMKDSANRKNNMAFTKYYFNNNQFWDREIKFSKSLPSKATDIKEETKGIVYNIPEALKVAHSAIEGGSYSPDLYTPIHDDFDGLLIKFIEIPNFKKRKDINVCGY